MQTRRSFLKRSSLIAIGSALSGCVMGLDTDNKPKQDVDFSLSGDPADLKSTLRSNFSKLKQLAEGGRENLKVGFETLAGNKESVEFEFRENGSDSELFMSPSVGGSASLVWNGGGFTFLNNEGDIVERNGEPLEFHLSEEASLSDLTLDGLLELGIKLVAVGLSAWLVAKLAGAVLAALAFVAFSVFTLGLVFIGVEILADFASWALSQKELENFLDQLIADFLQFINELERFLENR